MKILKKRLAVIVFGLLTCHFILLLISFVLVGQHSNLKIPSIAQDSYAASVNTFMAPTNFPIDGTLSQKLSWCFGHRPCGRENESLKQVIVTCDPDPDECPEKPNWCSNCKELLEF